MNTSRSKSKFILALETLAATACLHVFIFGGVLGVFICLYLLKTSFWWITPLYIFWIYLDRTTCVTGGRSIRWVRNWAWFYYMKQYYPSTLLCVPGFTLNPQKNYLFACFPHGILPAGPFTNIVTGSSDFYKLFPNFSVNQAVLHFNFFLPFVREFDLSIGCVSCSARSINFILSQNGGQVLLLWPGGAVEAFGSQPGRYKFVVKKRKGFVKMALKNGVPLVPVITFGETDMYEQIENFYLRKVQEVFRRYTGVAPVLIKGTGIFQDYFGVIPRRNPLVTVGT